MTWSKTEISKKSPACFNFLVSSKSAWLGLRLPDGWLCTKISALAKWSSADLNISLGSAMVPAIPT
jgi:hypothetical protein